MEKSDFKNLDFRALEVMKLVYDLGSLSAAAEKLGQNQSSVSYTIDRLRAAFSDPLFVRAGRGVVPTARCEQMIVDVADILDHIAELARPPEFDPAHSTGTFVISCNHMERALLMPAVIRKIQKIAPGFKLKMVQSMLQGHRQLNTNDCDILLSPVEAESENLYRQKILQDQYVCVVDAKNPLAGKKLTLNRYQNCRHIAVTYGGGWRPLYMDALDAKGIKLDVAVEIPNSGNLLGAIEGTHLVITMPSTLTRNLDNRFKILECPIEAVVTIYQFWTSRTHHSPAHKWLRQLINEEAQKIRSGIK